MVAVIAAVVADDPGDAQDPGAVREAHRRAPDVRRREHAHPAARQHRGRDPDHLRLEHHDPAGHGGAASCRPTSPLAAIGQWFNPHRRGSTTSSTALIIIFFTYFYTAVVLNPNDLAENMRKYGGFVPGIRPGRKTAEYIDRVLSRITLPGAIFLALIAVLPGRADRGLGRAVPRASAAPAC